MFELREAAKDDYRPVIALVTDENPLSWATPEVARLCKLNRHLYVDVSKAAQFPWSSENGPTAEMLSTLRTELDILFRILNELNCQPSMMMSKSSESSVRQFVGVSSSRESGQSMDRRQSLDRDRRPPMTPVGKG